MEGQIPGAKKKLRVKKRTGPSPHEPGRHPKRRQGQNAVPSVQDFGKQRATGTACRAGKKGKATGLLSTNAGRLENEGRRLSKRRLLA